MIIANMAIQIAKTEFDNLMRNLSTYEERENAFNRMLKISQSCTLSLVDVIDTVYGFVLAGHGSVDDALRKLERRYLEGLNNDE